MIETRLITDQLVDTGPSRDKFSGSPSISLEAQEKDLASF